MAIYSIPFGDSAYGTYTLTLEGTTTYDFTFRYNGLDESWTGWIALTGEDPLCSFKMLGGRDLLKSYRYISGMPQGYLFLYDTMYGNGRCDDTNVGQDKRFQLTYITSDDTTFTS